MIMFLENHYNFSDFWFILCLQYTVKKHLASQQHSLLPCHFPHQNNYSATQTLFASIKTANPSYIMIRVIFLKNPQKWNSRGENAFYNVLLRFLIYLSYLTLQYPIFLKCLILTTMQLVTPYFTVSLSYLTLHYMGDTNFEALQFCKEDLVRFNLNLDSVT